MLHYLNTNHHCRERRGMQKTFGMRSVDTVRFFCSAVRMSDQVTPNQIMSLSDGLVITTVDLMVFLMSFDSDDHY